jgi:phage terminase small subunit
MNEQLRRVRFTPKQHLYIEAYLIHKNATKAAIAAGFSERSANNQGARLMANDAIRAEIEARLSSTFDRYAVTSDRIIRELAKIAFANIGDFITVEEGGGAIVDFGTATREQMASLKSIEIDERSIDGAAAGVRRIKISLSDKRQALMDLAKLRRMLPADRLEHSGAIEYIVKPKHTIDIESMDQDQREQLRTLLLNAVGGQSKAIDVESQEDE